MFKDFYKEIEEKLIQQKQELEAQLAKIGERNKERNGFQVNFPKFGEKEDENAEEVSAFGDRLSLGLNLEKSLEEVKAALEKLKRRIYGNCEKCGASIDKKRLKAFPAAKLCLNCKK